MKKVATMEEPFLLADHSAAEKDHTRQLSLNAMLIMLLKNKALELRRGTVEKDNGLEVWRAFHAEWGPQVQNRFGGFLV